jgi:hypothetical protein
MLVDGVKIQACPAFAYSYGVREQLHRLGIDVKHVGKPLTDRIKQAGTYLLFRAFSLELRTLENATATPFLDALPRSVHC